jgi:HD-GYP domain-containing protein (c-di-GMP phosphodiesterase class II)
MSTEILPGWFQMPTAIACPGLFVAQLDRPWSETTFPVEGFLLDDETVAHLQLLCSNFYVDPNRSNFNVLRRLPPEYTAHLKLPVAATGERSARQIQENRELFVYGADKEKVGFIEQVKRDMEAVGETEPDAAYKSKLSEPKSPASDVTLFIKGRGEPELGPELPAPFVRRPFGYTLFTKMREFMAGFGAPADPQVRPDYKRLRAIPTGQYLLVYPQARPVSKEELKSAAQSLDKVDDVAKRLFPEIAVEFSFDLEGIEDAISELVQTIMANPDGAMWMLRMREFDSVAYARSVKASVYTMVLGRHLGYPREGLIKLGMLGMLLDVGKMSVEKGLLDTPGPLDEQGVKAVRKHVVESVRLIEMEQRLDSEVRIGIMQHHERGDGSGYPFGLTDRNLSAFGRIAGIVDSLVAMTSPRPYAPIYSTYDALMQLFEETEQKRFDAALVEQLVQAIGLFPVGSMVELSNGEVAAISAHNPIRRLEPKVLVLTDGNKTALPSPFERDLLYRPLDAQGAPIYIKRGLPIGSYGIDPRQFYLA